MLPTTPTVPSVNDVVGPIANSAGSALLNTLSTVWPYAIPVIAVLFGIRLFFSKIGFGR